MRSCKKLDEENVRIVRNVKQINLAGESIVAVVNENGERHEMDALYPALGCTVRSNLATALGACVPRTAILLLMTISGRPLKAFTRQAM
jgi:hypothetical protein